MAEDLQNEDLGTIKSFQAKVCESGTAKGFDFVSLAAVLFPLLIDSVKKCIPSPTASKIAARLTGGSQDMGLKLRTVQILRSEFQKSGDRMSSKELNALADSVLDSFRSMGAEGVSQMLQEYESTLTWQLA